jgi:hypothetical protein
MKTNDYSLANGTALAIAEDQTPDLRDVLRMIGIKEVTANVFSLPKKKEVK